MKKLLTIAGLATIALAMSCEISATFLDYLSAPYGYVYEDIDGEDVPVVGATVSIYDNLGTVSTDDDVLVGTDTTSSTGYFTLLQPVEEEGGSYRIDVTPDGGELFSITKLVPSDGYLWDVGTIYLPTAYTVSGTVIDSRTGTAVDAADVTIDGNTVATDANGAFTVSDLMPGLYEITVEKAADTTTGTAYFFMPAEVEITNASIEGVRVKAIGFNTTDDDFAIIIAAFWSEDFADVDIHATYPASGEAIDGSGPTSFSPAFIPTTGAGDGFSPEDLFGVDSSLWRSRREAINFGNMSSTETTGFDSSLAAMELDIDDQDGAGPETMTLRTQPWTDTATNTIDISGIEDGATAMQYNGIMEVYLRAYSSDGSPEKSTESFLSSTDPTVEVAEAEVWVIQTFADLDGDETTDDPGADILGRYTVPEFTNIKNASIVRIHAFTEGGDTDAPLFVVYPDIQLIPDEDYVSNVGFRGIGEGEVLVSRRRD